MGYYITVLIVIAQLLQTEQILKKQKSNFGGDIALRFLVDFHSRTPIYEQIKEQIINLIGRGELETDDQLPSLRQLSAELAVNINTIKRAFSDLESQGIIYSVAGKGSFISAKAEKKAIAEGALKEVGLAASKAKSMGAKKNEIIMIVNRIYEGDETYD